MAYAVHEKIDKTVTENVNRCRNIAADGIKDLNKDVHANQNVEQERNLEKKSGEEENENLDEKTLQENDKSEDVSSDKSCLRNIGNNKASTVEFVIEQSSPSDDFVKNKHKCEHELKNTELYNSEIEIIRNIEFTVEKLTCDSLIQEKNKLEHGNTDGETNHLEIEDSSDIRLLGENCAPCDDHKNSLSELAIVEKSNMNILDGNMIMSSDAITEKSNINSVDSDIATSVDVSTEKGNKINGKMSMSLDVVAEQGNKNIDEKALFEDFFAEQGNTNIVEKCMSVDIIKAKGNTNINEKSLSGDIITEKGNTDIDKKRMSVDVITEQGNINIDEKSLSVDIIIEKGNTIIDEESLSVDIITEKGNKNVGENSFSVDIITDNGNTNVDEKSLSVDIITEKGNTIIVEESLSVDIITEKGNKNVCENSLSEDIITDKDNTDIDENSLSVDIITDNGNSNVNENPLSADIMTEKGNTIIDEESLSVDIITDNGNTNVDEESLSVDIITDNSNTNFDEKSLSVDIITDNSNTNICDVEMLEDVITEKGKTNLRDNISCDSDLKISVDVITENGNKNVRADESDSLEETDSKVIKNADNEEDISDNVKHTADIENLSLEPCVNNTGSQCIRKTCHRNDKMVSESELISKIKESASDWSKCFVKLNKLNEENLKISDGISGKHAQTKKSSSGNVNVIYRNRGSKSRVTTEVIVDGVIIEETYNIENVSEKQKVGGKRCSENLDCKKKIDNEVSEEPGSDHIRNKSKRIMHKKDTKNNCDSKKQRLEHFDEEDSSNLVQSESPRTRNKTKGTKQNYDCERHSVDNLGADELSSGLMKNDSQRTRNRKKEDKRDTDGASTGPVKNVSPKTTNKKIVEDNFKTSKKICVDVHSCSVDDDLKTRGRTRSINTRPILSKQTDCSDNGDISYLDKESIEKGTKKITCGKYSKISVVKVNEKEKYENLEIDEENVKRKTRQSNVDDSNQGQHVHTKKKDMESQQENCGIEKYTLKRKTRQNDNDVNHKCGGTVEEKEPQWLTDAVSKRKSLKRETSPDDIFDEFYQCLQDTKTPCVNDTSITENLKRKNQQIPSINDKDECVQNDSETINSIETSLKIKPCSVKIIRCDPSDICINSDKIPSKKRKISRNHNLNNACCKEDISLPEVRYSPICVDFDAEELDVIEPGFPDGIDLIETCLDILDNDLDACMATTSGLKDKCADISELKPFVDKYCDAKLSNCTVQLVRIDKPKNHPGKSGKCQNNRKTRTDTSNKNDLFDVSETRTRRSEKCTINTKQSELVHIGSDMINDEIMSDPNSNEEFIEQYCVSRRTRQRENLHKKLETKPSFGSRELHVHCKNTSKKKRTESDLDTDIAQPRTTRGKRQWAVDNDINKDNDRKQDLVQTKCDYSDTLKTSESDREKGVKRASPSIKRQRIDSGSLNKKQGKALPDIDTETGITKTEDSNNSVINSNKCSELDSQSNKLYSKVSVRLERCRSLSGKLSNSEVEDVFIKEGPESNAMHDVVGRRCRNRSENTSNNKTKDGNTQLSETECVGRSKRTRRNSGNTSNNSEINQSMDHVLVKRTRKGRNISGEKSDSPDVSSIEISELDKLSENAFIGKPKRCKDNSKISDKKKRDICDPQSNQEVLTEKEKCDLKGNIDCVVKLERLNISKDITLLQHQDAPSKGGILNNSNIDDKLQCQNCDNDSEKQENCETGDGNKTFDSELILGQNNHSSVLKHDAVCKPDKITENVFLKAEENGEDTETSQDGNVFSDTKANGDTVEISPTKNREEKCDNNIEILTDSSSDEQMEKPSTSKYDMCDSNIEIFTDPSTDDENNISSLLDSPFK